ncbi:1198_t:CDS:1 [Acaulospora morrowiae]|uniref:1198_t:CDS:1 n=1 Tax=Acaulospora morrowiae TaxID=94023 RepID=A0A9N9FYH8_9GLOM|nr:1198_t:CDS:1 [Acaulospora morrowiae]
MDHINGKNRKKKLKRLRDKPTFNIKKIPRYPPLSLPLFPPTLEEVVDKLMAKPRLARFPNSFIIFRSAYVKHLKSNGHNLPMTELSSMVARSWEAAPSHVKEVYAKISKEAEQLYNHITKMNQLPQNQLSPDESLPTTSQPPLNEIGFPNGLLMDSPILTSSWPSLDGQTSQMGDYVPYEQRICTFETQDFSIFSMDTIEFLGIASDVFYDYSTFLGENWIQPLI